MCKDRQAHLPRPCGVPWSEACLGGGSRGPSLAQGKGAGGERVLKAECEVAAPRNAGRAFQDERPVRARVQRGKEARRARICGAWGR